jgi:hypothetical protein
LHRAATTTTIAEANEIAATAEKNSQKIGAAETIAEVVAMMTGKAVETVAMTDALLLVDLMIVVGHHPITEVAVEELLEAVDMAVVATRVAC